MQELVDVFSNYLLNEKKCAKNTYESYMRDINQFVAYCTENEIDKFDSISKNNIDTYLEFLNKTGKSESSVNRSVASLRAMFRYFAAKGKIGKNPLDSIHIKKTKQKMPGILDPNEVMLLLNQPSGSDFKSVRDKAMLELLYATGIKVSELIELKLSDINLQVGILYLHDKNERIIPIYQGAVKTIANYLSEVRPMVVLEEDETHLFTNLSGQPMSRQGFWKIIKHYAADAGISKDITPQTFRHSFAAHLLENGAQLKDIKEMLGHSDISSTQIYAQFLKSKYTLSYTKFHPLAK